DYNLDGINIDIENMTEVQRSAYVDFVRLLREKLPDKVISVAVAGNPYEWNNGWQGSYDYAGLAAYCDYLIVMAYDEHYQNGPSGAVASMSFVENSIKYALTKVAKEKIVLGLPFYGRIWKNGGGYPKGYGVSNVTIDSLIGQYHGNIAFDAASRTSYATITVGQSDAKPVIGGGTLTAGTYTIWYADEQTTKEYLTLVQTYDIKGAGSWSLGQESENIWDYYKLWLNGCYLEDIQTHWAKDAIFSAFQHGWMKGVSNTAFLPEASLTRAQAAVILVRMLGYSLDTGTGNTFTDIAGHWAQAEIETARQYGLIGGVGNNRFEPDRPITREEMTVILTNILKMKNITGTNNPILFPDVSSENNSWSYEAIDTLSRFGIILGYADGGFHPHESLNRSQMAVMIGRLSIYIG
ncbi:glycoside hydrolase, partial [bacterium]|nr:glycoside hydrolase [bacterium]